MPSARSAPSASPSRRTSTGTATGPSAPADGHAGFQAARFFAVSIGGLLINLAVLEILVGGGLADAARAGDRRGDRDAGQLHRQQAVDVSIAGPGARRRRFLRPSSLTLLLAGVVLALVAPPAAGQADPIVGEDKATRAADRDPKVAGQRSLHGDLTSSAELEDGNWEVGYFAGGRAGRAGRRRRRTGLVRESWTGHQVAWKMARGYEGTFGHKLNAPYVFLPLCALFLLGLVDWRRPWRVANLDLLVLLGFRRLALLLQPRRDRPLGAARIPAAPLPAGAHACGSGCAAAASGLRPVWPAAWLLIAALFLVGFRVGLNIADSGVIDVGYASVVGADRIADGEPIYGRLPRRRLPGRHLRPGQLLRLRALRAGLALERQLGRPSGRARRGGLLRPRDVRAPAPARPAAAPRPRGPDAGRDARLRLGGLSRTRPTSWSRTPTTPSSPSCSSLTLLLLARPAARGALLGLATLTKFAPLVLAPMLATYDRLAATSRRGAAGIARE